jgi:hypothetical protein
VTGIAVRFPAHAADYFFFKIPSLLLKRYRGLLPSGIKWPAREAYHIDVSSAEVKNKWGLFLYALCLSSRRVHVQYHFTPWSGGISEKLTGPLLVRKFSAFYGTRRFVTAFTKPLQLSSF